MKRSLLLPLLATAGLAAVIALAITSHWMPGARTATVAYDADSPPAPAALPDLQALRAFPNLTFDRLTNLVQPRGSPYFYVTEQQGRVFRIAPQGAVTDDARAELVLDIRGRTSAAGWEDGLLGLAFHPRFVRNRYVYVLYTGLREQLVLSRFSVPRSGEGAADPGSEVVILEIEKPHPNHNGGQLAFGRDGFLYIGLGDGGEPGNGQDLQTLLGSILRIDIDHAEDGRAYGIPEDNPFHGVSGAREEIWAYGFRNPWRFSFEPGTGRLWVADPGEQGWDEINLAEPGLNYGWPLIEGDECHDAADKCEGTKLVRPLVTHQLYTAGNCALIGGLVYRAEALPGLKDAYIYGDFCTGAVWGLRYNNGAVAEHQLLAQTNLPITSFGVDAARDLLFVTHQGEIYALVLAPGAGTVSEDSSGSAG